MINNNTMINKRTQCLLNNNILKTYSCPPLYRAAGTLLSDVAGSVLTSSTGNRNLPREATHRYWEPLLSDQR